MGTAYIHGEKISQEMGHTGTGRGLPTTDVQYLTEFTRRWENLLSKPQDPTQLSHV